MEKRKYINATEEMFSMVRRGCLKPESLDRLVKAGADINARNMYKATALICSSYSVYFTSELFESFISHGADINARDRWGDTALLASADGGSLTEELLSAFVQHGADINDSNDNGSTALMLAARSRILTTEFVNVFVSHGANLNKQDKNGFTVLMELAENTPSREELTNSLRREELTNSLRREELTNSLPGFINAFIYYGAKQNKQNKNDFMVLMELIKEKSMGRELADLFTVFTQNGADINIKDKWGDTVFDIINRK